MQEKMKNTFRRLLSIVAAIAMAIGIVGGSTVPAMAAGSNTITIDNAQPGQTYTLYKLFSATVNDTRKNAKDSDNQTEVTTSGINYTLTDPSKALVTGITYTDDAGSHTTKPGSDWFNSDNAGNITKKEEDIDFSTPDFREWAIHYGTQVGQPQTANSEATTPQTLTFNGLDDGYYFITSTMGSLVTVTSVAPNAIVRDKNSAPGVDKIENVKTSSVGDTVTYTIHISIPKGQQDLIFHDTLSSGLTLDQKPSSFAIQDTTSTENSTNVDEKNYTVDYWNSTTSTKADHTNGDNITISFKNSYLDTITSQKTLTFSYTVKVNKSAYVNMYNSAHVSYGHNSSTNSKEKTIHESVFNFKIYKVDGSNNNTPLNGAQFVLSKQSNLGNLTLENYLNKSDALLGFDTDGTYNSSASTKLLNADNSISFLGLNNDENNGNQITYYLYEVKAPDGYNKLDQPIAIRFNPVFNTTDTTSVDSYTVEYRYPTDKPDEWRQAVEDGKDTVATGIRVAHTFNVINTQGSVLPSTGGIGTTVFYVLGGCLIAAAAVALIARKKRNA